MFAVTPHEADLSPKKIAGFLLVPQYAVTSTSPRSQPVCRLAPWYASNVPIRVAVLTMKTTVAVRSD
jgi:hypothetical protein